MSEDHLFAELLDFAVRHGARNLSAPPKEWTHEWEHDGMQWRLSTHGYSRKHKMANGGEVLPPSTFTVDCNGWPAAIVDPAGWCVAAGSVINEAALRAAIVEGGQP